MRISPARCWNGIAASPLTGFARSRGWRRRRTGRPRSHPRMGRIFPPMPMRRPVRAAAAPGPGAQAMSAAGLVIRDIPQADAAVIAGLAAAGVSTVHEAQGRSGSLGAGLRRYL